MSSACITRALGGLAVSALVTGIAAAPAVATAQEYPTKVVEIIVPFAPGGTNDVLGRIVANALGSALGKQAIVVNKPGGSAAVGSAFVARAAADGHTLLVGSQGSMSANPHLMPNLPYQSLKDFAPVALIGKVNNVLVVPIALKLGNVGEFTQYAKANPGKLNFGHAGVGTSMSLAGELYMIKTGTQLVSVPYQGSAPATLAVINNEVQAMFANTISVIQNIRAGQLRPLGVTGERRDPLLPEVPTLHEQGVAGYKMESWFGIFAPAGTPRPIVDRLYAEFSKALASADLRERLARLGADATPLAPDAFGRFVRAEQAKYERIVKASGARVD